jgi:dimethylamine monooxygenase subunit A
VHGPVPDYAAQLAANVDRFLARLKPERAYIRSNWGLARVPDLFLPEPTPPVDPRSDTEIFFRREDQSFLKLPETGAVIFAIRTTVQPWMETPEDQRTDILKTIDGLTPGWLTYKSIRRDM